MHGEGTQQKTLTVLASFTHSRMLLIWHMYDGGYRVKPYRCWHTNDNRCSNATVDKCTIPYR